MLVQIKDFFTRTLIWFFREYNLHDCLIIYMDARAKVQNTSARASMSNNEGQIEKRSEKNHKELHLHDMHYCSAYK